MFDIEQLTWSSGELDEKLAPRKDVTHFYAGARRLRNVFVNPQGGFRRRDGLALLAKHPRQLTELHLDVTGVTVSALNGGTAANMIDDTTATNLTTTGSLDTTNPWGVWKVDLGAAKQVMFIDLQSISFSSGTADGPDAETPYTFAIEYSDDDTVWTIADHGTIRVLDATERDWRLRVDSSHRYWRMVKVTDEDFTGSAVTVRELRFWQESSLVSDAKVIGFNFADSQRYKLVVSDRNVAVFKGRELVADILCPHLLHSLIEGMNWTQTLDTLLIFHQGAQTIRVLRLGYDEAWSETQVVYDNIPPVNFGDQSTAGITLTLGATTGVDVTATASGAIFTSDMVGWAVEYIPGAGYGRITSFTSTTVVKIRILFEFEKVGIEAGEWNLLELAWSNSRGWPQCGKVGLGRLWVGGTTTLPANGWGSRSGLFFDFDNGGQEDDMGVGWTVDADDVGTIYDIQIGHHVEIYTQAGEFFLLPGDQVITPLNISQRHPTQIGMKGPGLKAWRVEGASLFVQREGKAVREFLLSDSLEVSYNAESLSLLATHLIRDPVDVTLRRATSTEESDLYALVNSDGSLASFLTMRTQGINAWALQQTNGVFLAIGADKDDLTVVVERQQGDRWVEVFDREHLMDNSVRYDVTELPGTTISGLERFNGQAAVVVIDGLVEPAQVVSGGQLTLSREPDTFIEIGLNFPNVNDISDASDPRFGDEFGVWARLMPADINPDSGRSLVGLMKRNVDVEVQVLDTAGFFYGANDGPLVEVSFRKFGPDLLDQPLPTESGVVRLQGLIGVTRDGLFDIVQKDPVSMNITGVTRRVSV